MLFRSYDLFIKEGPFKVEGWASNGVVVKKEYNSYDEMKKGIINGEMQGGASRSGKVSPPNGVEIITPVTQKYIKGGNTPGKLEVDVRKILNKKEHEATEKDTLKKFVESGDFDKYVKEMCEKYKFGKEEEKQKEKPSSSTSTIGPSKSTMRTAQFAALRPR